MREFSKAGVFKDTFSRTFSQRRTPHTAAFIRFKVGLESHSTESSDGDIALFECDNCSRCSVGSRNNLGMPVNVVLQQQKSETPGNPVLVNFNQLISLSVKNFNLPHHQTTPLPPANGVKQNICS